MSALAEALVAAQRRAVAVLEKAYVAEAFEADQLREQLAAIGCADAVDTDHLIRALDVLRAYGGPLPAEPKPAANGDGEPAKATGAQVTFALDLLKRGNHEPLEERDLRNMPRERLSALIEALKAGTYAPSEWEIPF